MAFIKIAILKKIHHLLKTICENDFFSRLYSSVVVCYSSVVVRYSSVVVCYSTVVACLLPVCTCLYSSVTRLSLGGSFRIKISNQQCRSVRQQRFPYAFVLKLEGCCLFLFRAWAAWGVEITYHQKPEGPCNE